MSIRMNKTIFSLVLSVMLSALSSLAEAQHPKKLLRIGMLAMVPAPHHDAFQKGLRDLGYIEGENIVVDRRYAMGNREKLPELAAELAVSKWMP
jgi:putative tryptophan/tyrosine transport system substrate-binding protein